MLQLVSPDRVWSWLLVGFGMLILTAYFWARMLRDQVTVERHTYGAWVVAGDRLREQFTLSQPGQAAGPVGTGLGPVGGAGVSRRSGGDGGVARASGAGRPRACANAGACSGSGPWDVEMGDPLGFFKVMQHHPESTTIMVYPRASRLPDIELPRGRAPGRSTSSLQGERGDDPGGRACGSMRPAIRCAGFTGRRPPGTTS